LAELAGLQQDWTPSCTKDGLKVEFRPLDKNFLSFSVRKCKRNRGSKEVKKMPTAGRHRKGLKVVEVSRTEKDLRRALAANTEDYQAACELGILLAEAGREREAVPFLKQAVAQIGEPLRARAKELLARCGRKEAIEAMTHSRAVFQDVLRELQEFSPVAPAGGWPRAAVIENIREFKETIEKIEYTHSLEAGESVIEVSRADDGLIRLDIGVIAGAIHPDLSHEHEERRLTIRLDSPGTKRSRPAFRHLMRVEGGFSQQRVYLPLRKGKNIIRISGAAVQTIEARNPDCAPSKPPNQLIIPITSYCNFQCVMCPHGLAGGVRDKAHFPDAIADLLIADLNGYEQSCDVALTGLGESFMSPAFVRFVEAVKNPLVKFNFTTNGSMLTARRIEWLLSSKVWRVNVSLDAGTPETFFKIRRSDWSDVVRNLEALSEAIAASPRKDFWLELNMTLMRENVDEIEGFLRLAARLRAGAYLAYLNDYDCNSGWVVEHDGFVFEYERQILRSGPEMTEKISRARALAQELSVPFNMETAMRPLLGAGPSGERIESEAAALATRTPPISHCPAPWATDMEAAAVVHADGNVGMCCLQAPIGNIVTDGGLMSVWQGPTAQSVRQKMLAGEIPRQCAAANCSYVAAQRAWPKQNDCVMSANKSSE
jgi:MoaA/NifB/PqqE/SkfB family radical SAM enzyme